MKGSTIPELVRALENELYSYLELAKKALSMRIAPPAYRMDLRGKDAGIALLREHCIRFNLEMLVQQPEEFINDVVAHELAHLVAFKRFGARIAPHGKEWQWIMRDVFHKEPSVTHKFPVRKTNRKTFLYKCGCAEPREFSIIRHRRALTGTTYHCRICKQQLQHISRPDNSQGSAPKETSSHLYTCSCSTLHRLSASQHKKIKNGKNYVCSLCRQPLLSAKKLHSENSSSLHQNNPDKCEKPSTPVQLTLW